MKKLLFSIFLTGAIMIGLQGSPVAADPLREPFPNKTTPIDISWPQCEVDLGQNTRDFVIVGVNGGLATTTNPCLEQQLAWANQASGTVSQPKLQLYVNTANPGGLGTPSWPTNNNDPLGNAAPNPHGTCDNSDSLACAWQYGWNRSAEAAHIRFKPAAANAGIPSSPADYLWWLDIETENTWKEGSQFAYQSNVADIEGMAAYFNSLGAQVGLYSTSYQWSQIVGSAVSPTSNLQGLKSWLAGATNTSTLGILQYCSKPPLTSGGKVTTIQFVPTDENSLDYNANCYTRTKSRIPPTLPSAES